MRPRIVDQSHVRQLAQRVTLGVRRAVRFGQWLREGAYHLQYVDEFPSRVHAAVSVPLTRTGAQPDLEAGKRHNVRLAASAFHGLRVLPSQAAPPVAGLAAGLSFWRTVGELTLANGYRPGLSIADGCAVPTVGGGVCALTNALFALGAAAGWRIIEHHPHSRAVADPAALDATVFYPHIDLRMMPLVPSVLSATVTGDVLRLAIFGEAANPATVAFDKVVRTLPDGRHDVAIHRRVTTRTGSWRETLYDGIRDCLPVAQATCQTCNETTCHAGDRYLAAAGLTRNQAVGQAVSQPGEPPQQVAAKP